MAQRCPPPSNRGVGNTRGLFSFGKVPSADKSPQGASATGHTATYHSDISISNIVFPSIPQAKCNTPQSTTTVYTANGIRSKSGEENNGFHSSPKRNSTKNKSSLRVHTIQKAARRRLAVDTKTSPVLLQTTNVLSIKPKTPKSKSEAKELINQPARYIERRHSADIRGSKDEIRSNEMMKAAAKKKGLIVSQSQTTIGSNCSTPPVDFHKNRKRANDGSTPNPMSPLMFFNGSGCHSPGVVKNRSSYKDRKRTKNLSSFSSTYGQENADNRVECGRPECPMMESTEKEFPVCASCRRMPYCSIGCQTLHWNFHYKECGGVVTRKKSKGLHLNLPSSFGNGNSTPNTPRGRGQTDGLGTSLNMGSSMSVSNPPSPTTDSDDEQPPLPRLIQLPPTLSVTPSPPYSPIFTHSPAPPSNNRTAMRQQFLRSGLYISRGDSDDIPSSSRPVPPLLFMGDDDQGGMDIDSMEIDTVEFRLDGDLRGPEHEAQEYPSQAMQFSSMGGDGAVSDTDVNGKGQGRLPLPPNPPIKLVLFDMDNTFLKIHTHGTFSGDVRDLSFQVSEAFLHLVPRLLENGRFVGIVTFSDHLMVESSGSDSLAGEPLVKSILEHAFQREFANHYAMNEDESIQKTEELLKYIHIVGAYPRIRNMQREYLRNPMPNSKEWHMEKICTKIRLLHGVEIKPHEILFFDDSRMNIRAAQQIGVHSFIVDKTTAFTEEIWLNALDVINQQYQTNS